MKKLLFLLLIILTFSCSSSKHVQYTNPLPPSEVRLIDDVDLSDALDSTFSLSTPLDIVQIETDSSILHKLNTEIRLQNCIEQWQGVPYLYGGSSKQGIDCSSLMITIYRDVYDKRLPRRARDIALVCDIIPMNQLKVGDLIFFKIRSSHISHVGIYIGNNEFFHASTSSGTRVDSLNSTYYKQYFFSCGRVSM